MTNSFTNSDIANANLKRFDFQTVRTLALKRAEENRIAAQEPPKPVFTEADLETRYQKGLEEGKRAGIEETQKSNLELENRTNEALNLLAIQISTLKEAADANMARYKGQVASLALSIAKKVAGNALCLDPSAKVMECIEKSLPLILQNSEITIYVNPELAANVEEKVRKMFAERNITTHVHFIAQADTPITDSKLEWKGGGVEHQSTEQWKQIEKLLEEIVK